MGNSLYPSSGRIVPDEEWFNLRSLSDGVFLVASGDTWIEDEAVRQLKATAALPGMKRVVGMPDLHPGKGGPVGAAFFSTRRLYPVLVGGDIGCGMALWQTDIDAGKVKLDKLEKRLGSLDGAADADWLAENAGADGLPGTAFDRALSPEEAGAEATARRRMRVANQTWTHKAQDVLDALARLGIHQDGEAR